MKAPTAPSLKILRRIKRRGAYTPNISRRYYRIGQLSSDGPKRHTIHSPRLPPPTYYFYPLNTYRSKFRVSVLKSFIEKRQALLNKSTQTDANKDQVHNQQNHTGHFVLSALKNIIMKARLRKLQE